VLRDLRRVLLSVVVMAALAGAGVACSSDAPSCTSYTAATSVDLKDFSFDPGCLGASPGATLTLRDVGAAPHSFTVKGTDVNVSVDPGETATADLSGVAPGTYTVVCTYHPDMVGRLKVG
jgi:plastocyanin